MRRTRRGRRASAGSEEQQLMVQRANMGMFLPSLAIPVVLTQRSPAYFHPFERRSRYDLTTLPHMTIPHTTNF